MTTAPRLCERHGCTDTVLSWLHPRYCSRYCAQQDRGTLVLRSTAEAFARCSPEVAARFERVGQAITAAFADFLRHMAEPNVAAFEFDTTAEFDRYTTMIAAPPPRLDDNQGAPLAGIYVDELDARTRALEARRNRNTGPRPTRHRPPRTLDQKDRR